MGISSTVWQVALAVIFGAIGLYVIYKLGASSGSGTPAHNWSALAALEFTNNVSLVGLVLVIGLIAAVIVKAKMFQ